MSDSKREVTMVIPSISPTAKTLESVPDGVEAIVVTEGNISQARNRGAAQAKGRILVFCDDDVAFSEDLFWNYVDSLKDGEVLGLKDYDFGLLIGRFIVISKTDFNKVGGFDERLPNLEDTDFCIRAQKAGLAIKQLPRDSITHLPHELRRTDAWKNRWFYVRLFRRHGFRFALLFVRMVRRKIPR